MLVYIIDLIAWYERYFEITEEEYYRFGSDELDAIAESVHKEGTASQRFLFSAENEKNTENQLKLRDKAR